MLFHPRRECTKSNIKKSKEKKKKLTGLAVRALAMEAAHPIDARGPIETSGPGAIIDVHRTILPGPAVHADAVVRAQRVGARRAIMTNARPHGTLVHVHLARLARPLGRTRTRVTVHAVHARSAVETGVRYAVVNVLLAVFAAETCGRKNGGNILLKTPIYVCIRSSLPPYDYNARSTATLSTKGPNTTQRPLCLPTRRLRS